MKGSKNDPILQNGYLIDINKNNLFKLTNLNNKLGTPIMNSCLIISLFE